MDGVPMLAAVPAPEIGLTVAGFLRGGSMNVHTCVERVSRSVRRRGVSARWPTPPLTPQGDEAGRRL